MKLQSILLLGVVFVSIARAETPIPLEPPGSNKKPIAMEIHHKLDTAKILFEVAHKVRVAQVAHPLAVFIADLAELTKASRVASRSGGMVWGALGKTAPIAYAFSIFNAASAPIEIAEQELSKDVASRAVRDGVDRLNYLMRLGGERVISFQGKNYNRQELTQLIRKLHDEAMIPDTSTGRHLWEAGATVVPTSKNLSANAQHKAAQELAAIAIAVQDLNVTLAREIGSELEQRRLGAREARFQQRDDLYDALLNQFQCQLVVECESVVDGKFVNERRTVSLPMRVDPNVRGFLSKEQYAQFQKEELLRLLSAYRENPHPNGGCADDRKLGAWYNLVPGRGFQALDRNPHREVSTLAPPRPRFEMASVEEEVRKECMKVTNWNRNVWLMTSSYRFVNLNTHGGLEPSVRDANDRGLSSLVQAVMLADHYTSEQYQRHLDRNTAGVYTAGHEAPQRPRIEARR